MLLRRFTEHINTQNWLAVGLDFIIVVSGVFIGIQLGNLNQARNDRAAETSYLQRYHEDLTSTLDMFDIRLRSIEQQLDEVENAEKVPTTEEEAWETIRAYYQISGFSPPEVRTATYADMVSAGRLGLITNETLRVRIIEHYSRNGAMPILNTEQPFRGLVRGVIPHQLQDYLSSADCLEEFETYTACPAPKGETDLMGLATLLRNEEAIRRALNANIAHHRISEQIILSIIGYTTDLRDEIATELGIVDASN